MKHLDLIQMIDRNGVKFIPIMELAKIAGYEYSTIHWSGKKGASASYKKTFSYSDNLGFYLAVEDDHYSSDEYLETEEIVEFNQWILFQKLKEWYFELD